MIYDLHFKNNFNNYISVQRLKIVFLLKFVQCGFKGGKISTACDIIFWALANYKAVKLSGRLKCRIGFNCQR